MNPDDSLDVWDEDSFLIAALQLADEVEASRNATQNPNPPTPAPIPNPQPFTLLPPAPRLASNDRGGAGGYWDEVNVFTEGYSPPRELSERVPVSSIVPYGSRAVRAPLPRNGGYGGRGGAKSTRDREIERLKSDLERTSKELRIKECECKELQKDRDKKAEQLKDALVYIENKDAEIHRLKSTTLTHLPIAKVHAEGQSAVSELKNRFMIDNGLTSSSGTAVQENCFPKSTSQSKPSRTMGVQTDIVQDGGLSDSTNTLSVEYDLSSKLHAVWGFPGDRMLGRNLISELFVTCSADFSALFKCMSFPLKTNLDNWLNRNISDMAVHEGMQSPQLADAAKVSQFYEILMKVRHDVAPLQMLLEALFDLCTLENVVAAHKSLCILHAILQHLSCSTRLDRRNNVLVDQSQNFPEGGSIGLRHNRSETSTLSSFDLENLFKDEDRISQISMYLSFETLIVIFGRMQQIAFSNTEEYIQTEALSIMNITLMASNPSQREKFGLVELLESLPQLFQKEVGLCVRKQAVRLLFLLLNCPRMLSMFCGWQRDGTDHAKAADFLTATPTSRGIKHILDGLAECLACLGTNTQACQGAANQSWPYHVVCGFNLEPDPTNEELKLQRDVIVMLAFIASAGQSGFDFLLYSATPHTHRANFLELIIRVLASEMDAGKADFTKSQTFWKERTALVREALILLKRLASRPAYSKATLTAFTRSATAGLTIDVASRMSRKSQGHWKHDGTKTLQVKDEIVELAMLFKARVFTFLGESNP